jgi:hypothetical protein
MDMLVLFRWRAAGAVARGRARWDDDVDDT